MQMEERNKPFGIESIFFFIEFTDLIVFFSFASLDRALMEAQWCLHQLQHKLQRLRLVQQYHEKRISHPLVSHTGNETAIDSSLLWISLKPFWILIINIFYLQQRTAYAGWQCKSCIKRHKPVDTNDGHNANIITNATNAGSYLGSFLSQLNI